LIEHRDCSSNTIFLGLVLPKPVRERLLTELSKRLDIDFEEALTSPKLKLQLSPAELDSSLLELYEFMIDGPGGDLLRLIGGGGAIAMQNLYLRRKAEKERMKNGWLPDIFPALMDEVEDHADAGPLQRIRWAMRKNIPLTNTKRRNVFLPKQKNNKSSTSSKSSQDSSLKMSAMTCHSMSPMFGSRQSSFCCAPPQRGSIYMSPLI
jgi:hypothetical protein